MTPTWYMLCICIPVPMATNTMSSHLLCYPLLCYPSVFTCHVSFLYSYFSFSRCVISDGQIRTCFVTLVCSPVTHHSSYFVSFSPVVSFMLKSYYTSSPLTMIPRQPVINITPITHTLHPVNTYSMSTLFFFPDLVVLGLQISTYSWAGTKTVPKTTIQGLLMEIYRRLKKFTVSQNPLIL